MKIDLPEGDLTLVMMPGPMVGHPFSAWRKIYERFETTD